MDPVHDRGSMDPVHESGPWTRSKVGVHGPLVHVLSSPNKMAKNGHLIVRAITTAQDYQEGFMEESEEELDTDESLSGEDSDSLTENEECGD